MKITHNMDLSFHPIFNPLNQLVGVILDFGFGIADLLNRFALSFLIKLIRRRRTLNPKSKIQYPKYIWPKLRCGIPYSPSNSTIENTFRLPSFSRPFKSGSSRTNEHSKLSRPSFSTRFAAAEIVPPVAIKSSITTTLSPF